MIDLKTLLISFAAGFASVMCIYASFVSGYAGVPVLILAPLPIYVAALAWGTHAGVAASVSAIMVAATLLSPQVAIVVGLAITIPASILGHQANLAQENEQGGVEWYPLPQLLFNLCLVLAIAIVAVGYTIDYQSLIGVLKPEEFVNSLLEQFPPSQPLTDQELAQLTQTITSSLGLLPFIFASLWLIVHVVNLQFGAMICRVSNLLPRPKDDVPIMAIMPKAGLIILGIALAMAILLASGGFKSAASVFAGVFLTGFALSGLAAAHLRARSNPANLIFLVIGYILILLFTLPLYFFAIGGIVRTLSNSNQTPPQAGANDT